MGTRTQRKAGFTLVEILIVVVILGILAAVVIPQFTNASESAKGSSLHSQLQTMRSQLQLYQVQHNGEYPDVLDSDPMAWDQMTEKTDKDGQTTAEGATAEDAEFGPYLQQVPTNPFVSSDTASDHWLYDNTTGEIYPVLTADQAEEAGFDDNAYSQDGSTLVSDTAG